MQDGNTGARAEGRVGGARRGGRRSNTMLTFSMFCIDQGGNLAVRRHPFGCSEKLRTHRGNPWFTNGRRHEVRGMQGALSDCKGASLCCARSLALNLCVQASAVLGAPGCSLDGLPCHMSGLRQQTVQRPAHEARALCVVLCCLASLVVLPRSPFPVLCPRQGDERQRAQGTL